MMDMLRFATAGSVDDGKSTLIGRLLYDSKSIFEDQMDSLKRASLLRGESAVNLAYLTDGLKAEREQGITIDVAYRYFATPKRKFIIADTPGHEQYTRNMVTGASTAELMVLIVDARNGIVTQTKRHGFIASILGIQHAIVAVNKMDLVDYSHEVFDEIVEDYTAFSEKLDIHDITFIPISALRGDNVVSRSTNMSWYEGGTVLHHLESATISADRNLVDFRFPVQTVIRPNQNFRGYAGTVSSGSIHRGEEVRILPAGFASRVRRIVTYGGDLEEAFEAQAVVLELEDEIDVSRGDMIVRKNNLPHVLREFDALLCWMDRENSLKQGASYTLQHTSRTTQAFVKQMKYAIDVNTLHRSFKQALELNEIGRVRLRIAQPVFADEYRKDRATGSFILIDDATNVTVGAGMIRDVGSEVVETPSMRIGGARNVTRVLSLVDLESRRKQNGHKPAVLWLTGLSGSGKSTIARQLEAAVFEKRCQATHLDGDNLRQGLCSDLGVSETERHENLRRAGEVARLMYDAGLVVICSFISPYRSDREMIRSLFPLGAFSEIFVRCEIEECQRRDPKGLYKRAMQQQIENFTGVAAPYEEPEKPELVIDTTNQSIESSLAEVMNYLDRMEIGQK
jgi:bifunctional enzyme CysN/CysC